MKRAHGPLKTTPTCSAAHGNYCPWFTLTFASLTKSLCIFQFICQLKKKTTLYITDAPAAWIEVPVSSHGVQFCHPLVSLKLSADAAAPPWETGYHHPAQGLMRDFLTWVMGEHCSPFDTHCVHGFFWITPVEWVLELFFKIWNCVCITVTFFLLQRPTYMLISAAGKEIHTNEWNDITESQLPVFISNVIMV